jgi:hypothetical protein
MGVAAHPRPGRAAGDVKSGSSFAISILAVAVGLAIAYLDSSTFGKDARATAIALAASSFVFSMAAPRVAWFVGLAIGAPVVVLTWMERASLESLIGLAISAVGAAVGYGIGRAVLGDPGR